MRIDLARSEYTTAIALEVTGSSLFVGLLIIDADAPEVQTLTLPSDPGQAVTVIIPEALRSSRLQSLYLNQTLTLLPPTHVPI
jgi:hypothetical protein